MQKGEVIVAIRDFYARFTANYKCAEVKAIKMQLKCFVTLSGAFPTNKGNCSEIVMQLKACPVTAFPVSRGWSRVLLYRIIC